MLRRPARGAGGVPVQQVEHRQARGDQDLVLQPPGVEHRDVEAALSGHHAAGAAPPAAAEAAAAEAAAAEAAAAADDDAGRR
ncbi:MAG: hypothetical protein ACK5DK_08480, partial [Brevundimonas sp.]|uniref:hypothetical protein n=1 Tax=Brevundimonas sp. TaxID=1871086 RepID=UPI00391BA65B